MPNGAHGRGRDEKATIYALLCPEHGYVAYIGQTWRFQRRVWEYGTKSNNLKNRMVDCWVSDLLERGLKPRIEVIERTDTPDEREVYWIAKAAEMGVSLLNMTKGGKDARFMDASPKSNKSRGTRSMKAVCKSMVTYERNRKACHGSRS